MPAFSVNIDIGQAWQAPTIRILTRPDAVS